MIVRTAPETVEGAMLLRLVEFDGQTDATPPFKASRFVVPAGATSDEDRHDVCEVWMVASGEGEVLVDGRSLSVRAGDVVLFASNEGHQVHNTGPDPFEAFSVWWPPRQASDV
jgi:mannose-6-phosphate isomerase-like protein (cupin superfamily)